MPLLILGATYLTTYIVYDCIALTVPGHRAAESFEHHSLQSSTITYRHILDETNEKNKPNRKIQNNNNNDNIIL